MVHKAREHDSEAMCPTEEDHDSRQLDSDHLDTYFQPLKPLKPVQSHATDQKSTTPDSDLRRWQILAVMVVVCAGGLVTALDTVGVATVLPSIANDLSATTSELAWIGASYMLGSAFLQPIWPTLSHLVGSKFTLVLGFILFTAGSLIAALARQPNVLIAGRTIQGLGAGNLSLMCIKTIYHLYDARDQNVTKYIQIQAAVSYLGKMLGSVVGGLLASYVTWQWYFYIDLIIAGSALAVLVIFVDLTRSSHDTNHPALGLTEWLGSALMTTVATAFLVGLQLGGASLSWGSATIIGLFFAGCTVGAVFVVQKCLHGQIELPPWIRDTRSPTACLVISFLHGCIYIACLYYFPLYFQLVLGATPVQSGLWSLVLMVLVVHIRGITGLTIDFTGYYRPFMWMGGSLLTLGVGLIIALPYHWNYSLLVTTLLLISVGIGCLLESPREALYIHVPPQQRFRARVVYAFLETLGSAVGLVVGLFVLQNELIARLASSAITSQDPTTALARMTSLPLEIQEILRTILAASLGRVWILYTAAAGLCLLISFLIRHKTSARQFGVGSSWTPECKIGQMAYGRMKNYLAEQSRLEK
jgi:MFS family permease